MIEQFAKDPFIHNVMSNYQTRSRVNKTLEYLRGKVYGMVLDVGQRSPFTDELEKTFDCRVDNTEGDLDADFTIPGSAYDVIIYSHTIEHQFNPLFTLLWLKEVLKEKGRMYIMVPERGKFLWYDGHFHEIDDYRMRLLIKRAGLKIVSKTRHKVWRHWKMYFMGIRPLFRFFLEYNAIYEIEL